jgi:hypothetical protein
MAMENRTLLLTIECPYGKALGNCPIEELRKIPFIACLKKVDNLDEDRVESLIEHHEQCLRRRQAGYDTT